MIYHRCALYHASRACHNWVDFLEPGVELRMKYHTRLALFEGHGATTPSLLLVCRLFYREARAAFAQYLCLRIRSIFPYRALDLPGTHQADALSLPPRCTVASLHHLHLAWSITTHKWSRKRVQPVPPIMQLLGPHSELRTIQFSLTITSAVRFQSPHLGRKGRLRRVEEEMMLAIRSLPPAAKLHTLAFEGVFHRDWLDTIAQEQPNIKVLRGRPFVPLVPHPYSPEDDTIVEDDRCGPEVESMEPPEEALAEGLEECE